jgi:myosin heavy subunit
VCLTDLDKAAKDLLDYKHHYDRLGIEPHVYEVSSSAYRGLALEQTDQTILVTGESGAGKTETVKILMAHLATIPQTRPQQDGSLEEDSHSNVPMEIVSRVVSSSPVFEAFGNAKTLRNDNSSRFGKFTQLQFEMEDRSKAQQAGRSVPHTDLVGSHCTTYLLEKTRVVSHSPGERTYHIFYQLLAAPQEFKEELWPSFADCEAKDFVYLAQSGEISGHSDAALWTATQESLKLFQFQGDSLKVLMRALVIVLQLGNLVFDDHDAKSEYEEHHTMITSQNELETLAEMTGIEAQVLEETMTSSVLKTGTEVVKVKASPQQSKEWCDALAKEIYSRIFNLMIRKINEYTSVEGDGKTRNLGHISLLDIFGFEKFQVNRFEQLCINYANEKLQNKYVIDNFTQIKDEYEAEGVDLYDFGLVDNSEILELLEGRNGLIASLNEECHLPTGKNDESYVYKAKTKHRRSICFIDKKLHERTEFGIQHFAGSVVYNADKFVECNMDKLPEGIVECAAKTSNSLIQAEFETSLQNLAQEMPSKRISIKKNRFVFEKFQTQLKSLMSAMENSQTRYIRCIKPNNQLAPRKVDHACTLQQLECSGLMTAIAITRESFPNKLSYDFILDRYACLMRERDFENIGKMKLPEKVHHILSQWLESMLRKNRDGSRTMPFTCGKTQVYFKSGVQERLEVLRLEYFGKSAIVIQSMVRRVQARSRYTKAHGKVMTLQRSSRMFIEKTRFTQKRHSAIRLSAWMRGNWATQNVQDMRCERAATKIQSNYRSIAAIQRVERIRNEWAATKIQTIVRTHPLSQHFQRVRLAIVCIQKAAQARRHGLQEASIMIQTAWRAHSEQRKNQGASTIQHAYQKYVIRRGPLAKTKLKSILRRPTRNQERRVTEASSKTKSPSAVGFATEMPTTPPKSGFMYFMERSLDCLICDCPGSHPAAATAVAE